MIGLYCVACKSHELVDKIGEAARQVTVESLDEFVADINAANGFTAFVVDEEEVAPETVRNVEGV